MFTRILTILFFLAAFSNFALADNIPAWLSSLQSMQVPAYDKDVPVVVLYDEQTVSLENDGKMTITSNYAIKILRREGKEYASAYASYLVSSSKVRDINGWLIRANGTSVNYDKKKVIDIISDRNDVYNEGRAKIIDATNDADEGSIFGYQTVVEENPLFYQDIWAFQGRFPTLTSRYNLNLPKDWQAKSISFNHAEIAPTVNGTSYSWELRNLAPIPPEPLSPSIKTLAPYIAVNYAPNNQISTNRSFKDWTEVSRWATEMHNPQVIVDDTIAMKARDLTANATTELDKIRAIGNYVQNLQYISIDIGVGFGNGYRPRSSSTVLSRAYGDCKDKANLMRALLKSLRIEAYPIAIFSGDPTHVREEWASPSQFNHCIIAIKIADETKVASIINHPKLGRLMIFDATDPYTSVGDLPDHEQGSFALIAAGDNGGLSRMPITPPESNRLDRQSEVTIDGQGGVVGVIREKAIGQSSATFRGEFRTLSRPEYDKAIEGWLTRGATGAKATKITPVDHNAEGVFNLDVEFTAASYGQLQQGRLLVFKPVIVGRRESVYLTAAKRDQPVLLDSNAISETTTFKIPAGFVVDEMPDAVKLETAFGKYSTTYESKGDKIIFTRSLLVNPTTISVEKYNTVRDFYTKIRDAELAPIVLMKK